MLRLSPSHLDQVLAHASEAYPRECCGIFLGKAVGDHWTVTEVLPARNLARATVRDRYEMDPADRYRAETRARAAGTAVVGFYHSHPDHDVYFSRTDLENCEEYLLGEPWVAPCYAYLVVSVVEGEPQKHGAFLVRDGRSEAIPVEVK